MRQIIETVVSDMSGEPIQDGYGVKVLLTFDDARRNNIELDLSEAEAAPFIEKGREIRRRGRKPGSKNVKPDPKPS